MSTSNTTPSGPITVAQIRQLLEAAIEPSEPQTAIRTYLAAREGKKLTAADEPKLRATTGDATIRITKRAGMTHIEWGGYGRSGGHEGGSMLIAYTEQAAPIVLADVDRFNVAYFGAAVERNAARRAALADEARIAIVCRLLNTKIAAELALGEYLGYGQPLSVVAYDVEKLYQAAVEGTGDAWVGR